MYIFIQVNFNGDAIFDKSIFQGETKFENSVFQGKAYFSGRFDFDTLFHYILFEAKEKVHFEIRNLSEVSFRNTDITQIRFDENATWGQKIKEKFKVTDERQLVKSLECLCRWKDLPHNIHETEKLALFLRKLFPIEDSETIEILKEDDENLRINLHPTVGNPYLVRPDKERPFFIRLNKEKNKAILTENDLTHYEFLVKGTANPLLCLNQNIGLGSVKAIYRNLRENYEFRMRYDEAGEFFIREMELKRNYREIPLQPTAGLDSITVKNNWFRRNLFSLTRWSCHLIKIWGRYTKANTGRCCDCTSFQLCFG